MNTRTLNETDGILLMPAYGRTYETGEDMKKDWLDGKDFKLYHSGRYCSVNDLATLQASYATALIIDPRSPAVHTIY